MNTGPANTAPIRIAVVGLGKIASAQHIPAIAGSSEFRLAGTVDPGAGGRGEVPHFASFAALLASGTAFDAVSVCTPPQWRHAIACEALEAGCHVLLEKPPCASLSEVETLKCLADERGVSVFAAWHSRFAGGIEPARRWLAGKTIRSVAIVWREDVRVWHPGQDWIWRAGGFGVFDPGINALSIATTILPHPLCVREAALQVPSNCEAPIAAQMTLTDCAGVAVSVDLDFLQTGPQTWDITIITEQGTLVLENGGSVLTTPEGRKVFADQEYSALYRHWAALVRSARSEIDAVPLQLVADAFRLGTITQALPFEH